MKNTRAFAFALATLCGLSSLGLAGDFWDIDRIKQEIGKNFLPPAEDYPDADGVLLYEGHQVEMQIGGNDKLNTTETVHIIRRLFKNIEQHAIVNLRVYDGQELKEIEARTIRTDGSTVKLKKQDIYLIKGEGDGATLYSDTKTYRFTFAGLEKNAIIEYRYVIRNDFAFSRDQWYIQDRMPTARASYSLTVPKFLMTDPNLRWAWLYRSYNCPDLPAPVRDNPEIMETNPTREKIRFTWDRRDIPALEPEPMMPPSDIYWMKVVFAPHTWKTWDDVARWYTRRFFKPQAVISDNVRRLAAELTAGTGSDWQKAAQIFRYVQAIRYIAIDLGDSGWRPAEPDKVLVRKYGDCKDKSTLLIVLLRAAGIPADPVLVLTADDGRTDPSFPTMNFNHMIVKARPADTAVVWLDPTVRYCAAGELPPNDQDINVLVLNGDSSGAIERTPRTTCGQNGQRMAVTVNVQEDGSARFDISIAYRGIDAMRIRTRLAENPDKDLPDMCKALVSGAFINAEMEACAMQQLDSLGRDAVCEFSFTAKDALQQQGDLMLLTYDPLKLWGDLEWLRKKTRKYPVDFGYPRTMEKTLTIMYPAKRFGVRNRPGVSDLRGPGLAYRMTTAEFNSGKIVLNESYRIEDKLVGPQQYGEVLSFYDSVQKQKNEKIILTQTMQGARK